MLNAIYWIKLRYSLQMWRANIADWPQNFSGPFSETPIFLMTSLPIPFLWNTQSISFLTTLSFNLQTPIEKLVTSLLERSTNLYVTECIPSALKVLCFRRTGLASFPALIMRSFTLQAKDRGAPMWNSCRIRCLQDWGLRIQSALTEAC